MNSCLQRLRELLDKQNIDAIFISSLPNIIYLTNFSDFTTTDRDGFLLITKKNQYIFTHGIYKEAVERNVKEFKLIPILRENPISVAIKKIITDEKINILGFESFDLKVNEYEKLIKEIDKKILVPTDIIHELRIIKSSDEIKSVKKACQIGDKAFNFILEKLKSGITEIELAVELEFFIRHLGANISFPAIVAFGANASKPHHVPSHAKLKLNSFVLFDFGVMSHNYCSDMSRTIFFGKASKKQKDNYKVVLESQKKAIAFIENQLKINKQIIGKDVDKISRDFLIQNNFPSMPHSLGHGIGLEVHESPRLTILSEEVLTNGMVFSIEPGIYLPEKFGIRIEDLFAIENNKFIQLTKSPKKFIEI